MKKDTKEINLKSILFRALFYIALFVITVGLFKYFQNEYRYNEYIDIPFGNSSFSLLKVILNCLMIVFFFVIIICSSIFNIVMRKKTKSNNGNIFLLVVLTLILIINTVLFLNGFFSIDEIIANNILDLHGKIVNTSCLNHYMFFVGETITFLCMLTEVFLELIEKEHIQKGINTAMYIILLLALSSSFFVPEIFFVMVCLGIALTIVLLYLRRESKPIRLFIVMLWLIAFLILINFNILEIESHEVRNEVISTVYIVIMNNTNY